MLIWRLDEHSEYFPSSTVELSYDQQKDKDKYRNNKYDSIYHSLNVFMIAKKIKQNKTTEDGRPIHYSNSHIRKYQDAILNGGARCR